MAVAVADAPSLLRSPALELARSAASSTASLIGEFGELALSLAGAAGQLVQRLQKSDPLRAYSMVDRFDRAHALLDDDLELDNLYG